ncbi:unnamed protein product, partial [Pocillopora meandrina]
LGAIKGKVISKIVGEKSRSVYRKNRKRSFSGRRKQKQESEETAPDVDEIAASTPSTSLDENQLSDSDSKETVDSSDEEYTFNTEESEGFRLINEKNLSTAVSKAHVCEKGTLTLEEDKSARLGVTVFPSV